MSDTRLRRVSRWIAHPVTLAAIVTLVNAAKPAVVDDTAYLLFARHIADQPTDPYGFDLFWYQEPEPAMTILAPPVLLYWLAAGIRLFGENLFLLKLWLFPFPLAFVYATRLLLARFAPGVDPRLLAAIVLGPGCLPFLNVMLDVPALALQASAIALFVRAIQGRPCYWLVAAAGVCTGLAVQTKYSVLLLPAVIAWYGIVHRRFVATATALFVATYLFAAWELVLLQTYGQSHFAFHVLDYAPANATGPTGPWEKVVLVFNEKSVLFSPLLSYLGATAWWVGPLGLCLFGVALRVIRVLQILPPALLVVLAFVPGDWVVLAAGPFSTDDRVSVNGVLWSLLGGMALAIGVLSTAAMSMRRGGRLREPDGSVPRRLVPRRACWLLHPDTVPGRATGPRRHVRFDTRGRELLARARRVPRRPTVPAWLLSAAIASGFVVAAVDTLDAYPEKELPKAAAAAARERGWPGTGWYVGHWGFQYYGERLGMRPLLPGRSELHPGDWLVLPIPPDGNPFSRPYDGKVRFIREEAPIVLETEFVWSDPVFAQTVPNLYGGRVPVLSRKHPRLRVALYRVVKPWRPIAAPPA